MAIRAYKRIRTIFNLLQPKPAPPTAWDNIYFWLVDKARVVLIISELIVAVVFVGKVIVDTQARSLDERVRQLDEQYRANYSTNEARLRTLQQKSQAYVDVWEASSGYADLLGEINSYLGVSSAKISITFTDDRLTVNGFSDKTELANFESAIKNSPRFVDVELFEVKSDSSDGQNQDAGFGLRARIKDTFARPIPS